MNPERRRALVVSDAESPTAGEIGRAAERRVLDSIRADPATRRARRATPEQDREGIDLIAMLKCGHEVRIQIKAGRCRKPAGYYASRGIVLIEGALSLTPARLEERVARALRCPACPRPRAPNVRMHSWVPTRRGWRCARPGCGARGQGIDDSTACKSGGRILAPGERTIAAENRRTIGLPGKDGR